MSLIVPLAKETAFDPRAAARRILLADIPREHHWTIFLLVIVLSGALSQLTFLLAPPPDGTLAPSGLVMAALVGAAILVLTLIVQMAGRFFGGQGRVQDAMILVLWLQFLMTGLQAVQLFAILILPGLGDVIAIAAMAFMLWVLSAFTAELHGWDTALGSFAKLIITAFGLSLVASVILAILAGLMPA